MKTTFLFLFILCFFQSQAQWQSSNGPYGGSINAMLSDNGNLYTAVYGDGGIYKSADDGEHWSKSNNGIPDINTYALMKNGTSILAATDNDVFTTTNDGISWTHTSNGMNTPGTLCLLKSGSRIFAGTYTGIFVSENNAASWTPSGTGLPNNCTIFSLHESGNRLLAGTGNGLFVSDNGGASWALADGTVNAVITNENTVYAWLNNGNLLFAGTIQGIFYSEDNGDHWALCDGLPLNEGVYSLASHNGILYAGTLQYGLYSSSDNGASWNATNNNHRMVLMKALIVHENALFTGTSGKGIFKTANGGANWETKNQGIQEAGVSLFAGNATSIFAAGYGNNLFRSNDEGNSWQPVGTGLNSFYHTLEVFDDKVFAGTEAGLYVSTSNGDSWSFVNPLGNTNIAGMCIKGTTLFAATFNGMFKSEDQGITWTASGTGLPVEGISSVVVNGNFLFATTNLTGGIYKSEDDGASWTIYNANIPSYVHSLNSFGSVMAAYTTSGAWFSYSNGQNWNHPASGWPATNGAVYAFGSAGPHLYIGSWNGVNVSADGGVSWEEVNDGFPPLISVSAFYVRGNKIYVGTMSKGTWRRNLSEITVSVDETVLEEEVFYPNPFSGKATLQFAAVTDAEIRIVDLSGKVLRSEKFSGKAFTLEQKNLASGTYLLQVNSNGETKSYKITIQ